MNICELVTIASEFATLANTKLNFLSESTRHWRATVILVRTTVTDGSLFAIVQVRWSGGMLEQWGVAEAEKIPPRSAFGLSS